LPRPSLRLTGVFVQVLAVGLAIAWALGSGDSTQVAALGEPAPDFVAEVIDGGSFRLSEHTGKPVVINFWASWCAPCRTEIPDISEYAEANPEVSVVGIAVEDAEGPAREFAAEVGASYPLALGTDAIEDAYPRLGLPVTYVIDPDGTVAHVFNGIITPETLTEAVG
jgi:thiol-disulfide isomerase/thioredoxin